MKLKTRDFVKNLAKAKAAAVRGDSVEILDERSGARFLLTAVRRRKPAFRDAAARDAGSIRSGQSDLSTIEGFDDSIRR